MTLTPLDIHNREFKKGFRGYNETEVDDFLDEIIKDFEALIKENGQLKDEMAQLKSQLDHYRGLETTLQSVLVVAQGTAEEVRANARKEAELILAEAAKKSEQLVQEAHERKRKILEQIDDQRRHLALFRARARSMLLSQLEVLDTAEPLEKDEAQSA